MNTITGQPYLPDQGDGNGETGPSAELQWTILALIALMFGLAAASPH